jgi:hypothetical protein
LGLREKPHREPYSIAASRVPVCQLNIGPQVADYHHDIGQHSARKIRIQIAGAVGSRALSAARRE